MPVPDLPVDDPDDPDISVARGPDGTTTRIPETADPVAFERQFETDREQTRALFNPPQFVQNQALQVESISEDFAALGQRIAVEITDPKARDKALSHLEIAYLLTLTGLSGG